MAPTRRRTSTRSRPSRQQAQRELVERGMKIPGVAEAIAAYGALQRHAPQIVRAAPVSRYASGGNQ